MESYQEPPEIIILPEPDAKDTLIEENYFPYLPQLVSKELKEIYYFYIKKDKNLNEETKKTIDETFKSYLKVMSESLVQTKFPYLFNSIHEFYYTFDKKSEKMYFITNFLINKKKIFGCLKEFLRNLTETNWYGIPEMCKNETTPDLIKAPEFKKFIKCISEWHAYIDLINFYISILKKEYSKEFFFDKEIFSIEKNFKKNNENDIFMKKMLMYGASYITSFINLKPEIDTKKLKLSFVSLMLYGFKFANMADPIFMLGKAAAYFGINYLAKFVSKKFNYQQNVAPFIEFSKIITFLIRKLETIVYFLEKLIALEIKKENKNSFKESEGEINKSIKDAEDRLNLYFKSVNGDYEINKLVDEEFVNIQSEFTEQEVEDYICVSCVLQDDKGKAEPNKEKDAFAFEEKKDNLGYVEIKKNI